MHQADRRMYAVKLGGRGDGDHTVEALTRALEEAKPTTETRSEDVATLTRDVARRLGLTPEEIDATVRAAKLHDVGKMAIPDEILSKPGPLDEAEWEYIRKHTVIGERIVAAAPPLLPVATLVRSSHERWDGGGYPDGLAGESIPRGARIVFACDAFDAMIRDRPYCAARTPEEAIAELRRCSGTQFEPQVVDAVDRRRGRAAGRPRARWSTLITAAAHCARRLSNGAAAAPRPCRRPWTPGRGAARRSSASRSFVAPGGRRSCAE